MSKRLATKQRVGQQLTMSGALGVLATAVFAMWALIPRWLQRLQPLSETGVVDFKVNIWEISSILPALTIPIVLYYLFALTPLFRPPLADKDEVADGLLSVAGLVLVHCLAMAWFFAQRVWPLELVLFPLILIGLLAGWRVGLSLGILTAISQSLYLLVGQGLLGEYRQAWPLLYRTEGLWTTLKFIAPDIYHLFLSADRLMFIWAGSMAGLTARWLSGRRFTPLRALVVSFFIAYLALVIPTLGHIIPGLIVPHLLAEAIAIAIGVMMASLIVGSVQATTAVRRAEAAEMARVRAELMALRAQINPHFFFNALNTIRYFVRADPQKARSLLLDLSDIFQRILRSGDFVTLADELSHIEAYLNLEQARLGSRLRYETEVADEALLDTAVPTLTLQPLVENAVIHGLAKKRAGGTIRLQLRRDDQDVLIKVDDDGIGIDDKRLADILKHQAQTKSIGLQNVHQRLQAIHGRAYGLSITSELGAGTCVVVRVPMTGG